MEGFEEPLHPIFCYFICDWPEGKRVTLTKDTTLTAQPCHGCECPCDQLKNLNDEARNHKVRIVEEMKAIVKEVQEMLNIHGQKERGRRKAKDHSLHVYDVCPFQLSFPPLRYFSQFSSILQNYFWKLPGCNIYIQIAPDLLHQFLLGVLKAWVCLLFMNKFAIQQISTQNLVRFLKGIISHICSLANGVEVLKQFEDSFAQMPRWHDIKVGRFWNNLNDLLSSFPTFPNLRFSIQVYRTWKMPLVPNSNRYSFNFHMQSRALVLKIKASKSLQFTWLIGIWLWQKQSTRFGKMKKKKKGKKRKKKQKPKPK